jgi:hypothetical protein
MYELRQRRENMGKFDELFGFAPIVIPEGESFSGILLDLEALEEAVEYLGIRKTVRFKWSSGGKASNRSRRTFGCHRTEKLSESDDYFHSITISHYGGLYETNETLWHELCHAKQCENFDSPSKFTKSYNGYGGTSSYGRTYRNNPYEVEAHDLGAEMKYERLLCLVYGD